MTKLPNMNEGAYPVCNGSQLTPDGTLMKNINVGGLTKLEFVSAMVLQGLVSHYGIKQHSLELGPESVIRIEEYAIMRATELLRKLEMNSDA